MDIIVFGAMMVSAFLHAAWNAWVKSRGDADGAVAALVIGAGAPSLLIISAFGLPPLQAWPWIAATVALSIVALTLLASAYREGDFAVAFPMIRGLIPVVLVIAAVPLFGEVPTLAGSLGVLLVSGGLGLVAWESARRTRTMTLKGLGFAALAAGVTAVSVMTDAKGARLSGEPFGYAATIAVLNSAMMAATQVVRGRDVRAAITRHWPVATFGVCLSMASYMLFIWSLMRAPVAMVAALRESSMLFALAIAVLLLHERVGLVRFAAVGSMLGGIVLIRM